MVRLFQRSPSWQPAAPPHLEPSAISVLKATGVGSHRCRAYTPMGAARSRLSCGCPLCLQQVHCFWPSGSLSLPEPSPRHPCLLLFSSCVNPGSRLCVVRAPEAPWGLGCLVSLLTSLLSFGPHWPLLLPTWPQALLPAPRPLLQLPLPSGGIAVTTTPDPSRSMSWVQS